MSPCPLSKRCCIAVLTKVLLNGPLREFQVKIGKTESVSRLGKWSQVKKDEILCLPLAVEYRQIPGEDPQLLAFAGPK